MTSKVLGGGGGLAPKVTESIGVTEFSTLLLASPRYEGTYCVPTRPLFIPSLSDLKRGGWVCIKLRPDYSCSC
jgi:hypothetical protein